MCDCSLDISHACTCMHLHAQHRGCRTECEQHDGWVLGTVQIDKSTTGTAMHNATLCTMPTITGADRQPNNTPTCTQSIEHNRELCSGRRLSPAHVLALFSHHTCRMSAPKLTAANRHKHKIIANSPKAADADQPPQTRCQHMHWCTNAGAAWSGSRHSQESVCVTDLCRQATPECRKAHAAVACRCQHMQACTHTEPS